MLQTAIGTIPTVSLLMYYSGQHNLVRYTMMRINEALIIMCSFT